MNEQELNKKLAEWAGFVYDEGAEYTGGGGNNNILLYGLWYPPNNDKVGSPDLPDFTQFLDACFKWLVPEAIKRFGELKVRWMLLDWIDSVLIDLKHELPPASSLCVGLDKLIDSEEAVAAH